MYKTEQRYAKEGEEILITQAHPFENYGNGQTFRVSEVGKGFSEGWVWKVEGDILQRLSGISPTEYEVIVGEDEE